MTYRFIFGECDCCAKPNRVLHHGFACGIEAYGCTDCTCGDRNADADDIQDEIETLKPKAETGEHWAHICALATERQRLLSA